MNKKINLIILIILQLLSFNGCFNHGKLNEGESKCIVTLIDMPAELPEFFNNISEDFEITVYITNIITEKKYKITLNKKNGYSTQISLNPGNYKVNYCLHNMSGIVDFKITSKQESINLAIDKEEKLEVYIDDTERFSKWLKNMQPDETILNADKFSRNVQLNGKVISLDNILNEVSFEEDKTVRPYQKAEIFNSDYGISVTLVNESSEYIYWDKCRVIGIEFSKNFIILGGGVYLGLSPSMICHSKEGIYGIPDYFKGTVLMGIGYDKTSAVYNDDISGDKITLEYSKYGKLTRINYEFEQFE